MSHPISPADEGLCPESPCVTKKGRQEGKEGEDGGDGDDCMPTDDLAIAEEAVDSGLMHLLHELCIRV